MRVFAGVLLGVLLGVLVNPGLDAGVADKLFVGVFDCERDIVGVLVVDLVIDKLGVTVGVGVFVPVAANGVPVRVGVLVPGLLLVGVLVFAGVLVNEAAGVADGDTGLGAPLFDKDGDGLATGVSCNVG